MEICTIGFTQKNAQRFFGILKQRGIKRLVDVRLHNSSQLAGFTKQDDLAYFLRELCGCAYEHRLEFAPTPELMAGWKGKDGALDWPAFEREYARLMAERDPARGFDAAYFKTPTALLCSEATPEHCHRRLAAEYLAGRFGLGVCHL